MFPGRNELNSSQGRKRFSLDPCLATAKPTVARGGVLARVVAVLTVVAVGVFVWMGATGRLDGGGDESGRAAVETTAQSDDVNRDDEAAVELVEHLADESLSDIGRLALATRDLERRGFDPAWLEVVLTTLVMASPATGELMAEVSGNGEARVCVADDCFVVVLEAPGTLLVDGVKWLSGDPSIGAGAFSWGVDAICEEHQVLISGIVPVTEPLESITVDGAAVQTWIVPAALGGFDAVFIGKARRGDSFDIWVTDATGSRAIRVSVDC